MLLDKIRGMMTDSFRRDPPDLIHFFLGLDDEFSKSLRRWRNCQKVCYAEIEPERVDKIKLDEKGRL